MDEQLMVAIEEKIREAVRAAVEERMEDLADELEDRLQDRIDEAVSESACECVSRVIGEYLSGHQPALQDGTVVQAGRKTRVMSPDKTKVLVCDGGIKVDGKTLMIQSLWRWLPLCCYDTAAQAAEALLKINAAIEQGQTLVEL